MNLPFWIVSLLFTGRRESRGVSFSMPRLEGEWVASCREPRVPTAPGSQGGAWGVSQRTNHCSLQVTRVQTLEKSMQC